jgi:membrane protein YqaA with SNARE-associated domain
MGNLVIIFAAVYFLNIIPAFAPPTWIVISIIGYNHSQLNPISLALTAAFAATLGRITLATLSTSIIRNKLLNSRTKENIDVIKRVLERRKSQTVGALLLYSFTPLPSNYLFIAYGLTSLPIKLIAVPFFIGRFTSYAIWILLGQEAYKSLGIDEGFIGGYMSVYFILTQFAVLLLTYLFTRIDWNAMLVEKKIKWLK